jgi:hypothetical protein
MSLDCGLRFARDFASNLLRILPKTQYAWQGGACSINARLPRRDFRYLRDFRTRVPRNEARRNPRRRLARQAARRRGDRQPLAVTRPSRPRRPDARPPCSEWQVKGAENPPRAWRPPTPADLGKPAHPWWRVVSVVVYQRSTTAAEHACAPPFDLDLQPSHPPQHGSRTPPSESPDVPRLVRRGPGSPRATPSRRHGKKKPLVL